MNIKQINYKFLVCLFLILGLGCNGQSSSHFDSGIYKRKYIFDEGDPFEIVELRADGYYTQKFYVKNQLRFSNSGKWLYIEKNKGHTPMWSNGASVILFSGWLSGDELLRREHMGDSSEIGALTKQDISAVVFKFDIFSFDYDGGSDYIKQK